MTKAEATALRAEVEELKSEVARLRHELACRPTYVYQVLASARPDALPGWQPSPMAPWRTDLMMPAANACAPGPSLMHFDNTGAAPMPWVNVYPLPGCAPAAPFVWYPNANISPTSATVLEETP